MQRQKNSYLRLLKLASVPLPASSRVRKKPNEVPENDKHRWMELYIPGGDMVRLVYWANSRCPREDPRVIQMFFRQGALCPLCCRLLDTDSMHLDHDIPLSKGGTAGLWNFQWCCASCNLKKGSSSTEEYFERLNRESKPDANQMTLPGC